MMMPHWLRHSDAGQIDALVTSTVECVYMVQSSASQGRQRCSAVCLTPKTRAAWASRAAEGFKLTAAVTKAVDDLNADGTIKLQDKWLAGYTTDLTELK